MATFTINEDNHITAFAGAQEAAQTSAATATSFDSQAALAKVSAAWPLSRFVEIWNSVPGNLEVKKFSDRKKAVARIWKALQPLAGSAQPSEPAAKPKKPAQGAKPAKKAKAAKKAAVAKKGGDPDARRNKKAGSCARALPAVAKEHPHKSPHTRRSWLSFWLERGL
jgi:hypothetical protein